MKEKKSRKKKLVEDEMIVEETPLNKAKLGRLKAKKKKGTSKTQPENLVQTKSSSVQLDTLQSIFATKDDEAGAFTLFGNDLITQSTREHVIVEKPVAPIPTAQPNYISLAPSAVRLFPHFDSPEKNSHSLFPLPEEPFFYNRTEYPHFPATLIRATKNAASGPRKNTP
jgi:hypothetical protein